MQILRKIYQRLTDPVVYRKRFQKLRRCCRRPMETTSVHSIEEVGDFRHVAVVVAHPDDETFCSGLICRLVDAGKRVDVLCLTRGEGGPTGKWKREELGAVREAEMKASCEQLGVASLVFLDHVDPTAKRHRVYAPAVSVEDLANQLKPAFESADLVISHGSSGEYWHPAHLLVHAAVKLALADAKDKTWMTFLACRLDHPIPKLVNLDDPAHLRLDVSGVASRREAALNSHASQTALFGRFAEGTVQDFIRKTSIETYSIKGREIG